MPSIDQHVIVLITAIVTAGLTFLATKVTHSDIKKPVPTPTVKAK